eukprot:6196725-Pleurochrysis_carterae.AAC.1
MVLLSENKLSAAAAVCEARTSNSVVVVWQPARRLAGRLAAQARNKDLQGKLGKQSCTEGFPPPRVSGHFDHTESLVECKLPFSPCPIAPDPMPPRRCSYVEARMAASRSTEPLQGARPAGFSCREHLAPMLLLAHATL